MGNPLFIDTDTASDDAVALMMAFATRMDNIEAIGVVAGNCRLEQAAVNALFVADLCGARMPVHLGESRPLARELETAQFVHGYDGMGDIGLVATSLVASPRKPSSGHAAEVLVSLADEFAGSLELVTLGPLTNIARALEKDPSLARKVRRCFMMGGASDYYGNITLVSEYNVWADPEAAEAVFASDMPITMIGWDISRKYAVIDEPTARALRAIGTRRAEVAVDCQKTLVEWWTEYSGHYGFDLPDPIAMAVVLDGTVATETFEAAVHVSLDDGLTRGQTIIDDRGMTDRRRNVTVVRTASAERFRAMLRSGLI